MFEDLHNFIGFRRKRRNLFLKLSVISSRIATFSIALTISAILYYLREKNLVHRTCMLVKNERNIYPKHSIIIYLWLF